MVSPAPYSFLYRLYMVVAVAFLITVTIDLTQTWRRDNETQRNLRARAIEVASENRELYSQLVKMNDELAAAKEKLYVIERAAELNQQLRQF